jgi:hypothetical protein
VPILSVDLAYKSYRGIGIVLIQQLQTRAIECKKIPLEVTGEPEPSNVAKKVTELANLNGCQIIMIDGPQAWKHPDNGHPYQRDCERKLNTPAKTGLPGEVLPANYRPFVYFSIDVFNYLSQLGFPRLQDRNFGSSKVAVEAFPLSAWKSLGFKPLKAKAKCRDVDILAATALLTESFPLHISDTLSHDELQAAVSGLGGLALEISMDDGFEIVGLPPVSFEGIWREGFIVNPKPWEYWKAAI